ncbi:histone deacetylase [Streptomyces marianii]|uniref:Histone deacetylase n=1 Tax=Streptomyces marianii TaxID=1817406 RepID=A0A5R9EB77_9ACTN|nr:histone deacetylase [Streptomyces marianii]TLQ45424.1 histone deacetylase [Streptomyces marianii]
MNRTRTIDTTTPPGDRSPDTVWYTAYGSNTHLERLSHYLTGGRPRGAARTYPGCRDPRPPAASVPVELPGTLYFATHSPVWRGGRAFYDPGSAGTVRARAHLVTAGQFSDIVAQEMYREPGRDLDLSEALGRGRAELGGGRYETLVCPGVLEGLPVLTFTAPWTLHDVEWTRPSAAYLRHLVAGLMDAGAWPASGIAAYLAACPGAAGHWTAEAVAALTAARRR